MKSVTPQPGAERAYRDALGRFATGVTIITTAGPRGPLAITANSFSSVSLDPPLVLWAPAKASSRFEPFRDAQRFAIHVLAENQLSLARHFARNGQDFTPVDWHEDAQGCPRLADFAARFTCTRHAVHDAGDHVLVLGLVKEAIVSALPPLIFVDGCYGRFAPAP
ncbi:MULTISPECIES: flavin reductase family protein [Actibacterium]|uniref:Flavin reductase (DIM6/NTAB) family NADH-FMN oxidoreductase RutF n=1 Tax=Actibacterium naphthalenivorans TaxID=1614693 RepID=A0A840CG93_9RHOB|nr:MULTISPECIES: flavin reductase family protein [Actibacterium]ALG90685.1 flavin oxidoreductase [Actibacterium sp. EMB200-NS6]MBB4023122.1 flavin reductase (DIM6/NTAB) family NADH-FMN oxidoreductase RutF [Actibacterium naphthalenivorans]